MDDDNSGSLDYSEFNKAVIEHKLTWTPAQTKLMFDHFDIDKNGTISYEEFVRSVRGPLNDKRKQFVMQAFQVNKYTYFI
jgi:Ca2+-binding EF-hand superfamily protein